MATNIFHTGQKLIAADLNNAIDSVAGIQNPSDDYKWTKTQYGRLQTSWDRFGNSKRQTPQPLDVQIVPEPLDQPIVENGVRVYAKRRIFVQLTDRDTRNTGAYRFEDILPVGDVNGHPFYGVIGWQIHRANGLVQGDGNPHFSLWAWNGIEPASITDQNLETWVENQHLYDDDEARCYSPSKQWYSGLCPEYMPLAQMITPGCLDIIAHPILVKVKYPDGSVEGAEHSWYIPFLGLCFREDYFSIIAAQHKQVFMTDLKEALAEYFIGPFDFDQDEFEVEFVQAEDMNAVLATYIMSQNVVDGGWLQKTNSIHFTHDFSAGHFFWSDGMVESPVVGNIQYIDQDGKQKTLSHKMEVEVTDESGDPVSTPAEQLDLALVMCYDYGKEPTLSCISCNYDGGDGLESITSSFIKQSPTDPDENHHDDARVVYIRSQGCDGYRYFDTCPDFRRKRVDSDLSTLIDGEDSLHLSSIQDREFELEAEEGEESQTEKIYSLWQFHDLENTIDMPGPGGEELEKYDVVVRYREDESTAEVKYMALSSLSAGEDVPPDADVPAAELSSIQWRELDNGDTVLQLFQFDEHDLQDADEQDEVVVKRSNRVEYVSLSSMSISGDVNNNDEEDFTQKSVETRELSGKHFHQLYKFDEDGLSDEVSTVVVANDVAQELIPDEYEFVLRKNGAGGEIEYAKVQLSVQHDELSGDSQVGEQKSISVENNVIQLYKMDQDGTDISTEVPTHWEDAEPILSDNWEFVIRKGGAGGEIDYTTVKLRQAMLSVDRQGHPNQRSLQYADLGDGTFLELNGFHADGTTVPSVALSNACASLLPADNEFLIRKKVNGFWQLEYAPLSVSISGDLSVHTDTDTLQNQKSIEMVSSANGNYLQLYGMDDLGEATEQVDLKNAKSGYQHLLPDDEEFVIRTGPGGEIVYKDVAVCLSAYLSGGGGEISGDANQGWLVAKSIQTVEDGMTHEKYHQLYNFSAGQVVGSTKLINFNDTADTPTPLLSNGASFVIRQPDGNGGTEIAYADISAWQAHEKLDSAAASPRGKSIQFTDYSTGSGCESRLELYNFDAGNGLHVTSSMISADSAAGILVRRNTGCALELQYMDFDSVKEMVPDYIGDKNLQYPGSEYHWSIEKYWDGAPNNKPVFELYNFRYGGSEAGVTIHNDGDTYYWPQNTKNPSTYDYVLVKHVDASGNAQLEYKQLVVTMPDIPDYGSQIEYLEGRVETYGEDFEDIYETLAGLSGEYWPQGGSNSDCYGSSIGNSNGTKVIDLDNNQLVGSWEVTQFLEFPSGTVTDTLYIGHNGTSLLANGHVNIGTSLDVGTDANIGNDLHVGGDIYMTSGEQLNIGCSYFNDGTLCLGQTTINEAQLSAILQLVQAAPQLLSLV